MATPNKFMQALGFSVSTDTSSLEESIKRVSSNISLIDVELKKFGDTIDNAMDRINKSVSSLDTNFKKLAGTIKETSSVGILGGGGGGFLSTLLGAGLGGGTGTIAMPGLGTAAGAALGTMLSSIVGTLFDQTIKTFQRATAYDASFANIGRLIDVTNLRGGGLRQAGLDLGTQLNVNEVPGFDIMTEGMDVQNLFFQMGKARADTRGGRGSVDQIQTLMREAAIGGRTTGMGSGETARVLMEQNRSLGMQFSQMNEYQRIMSAVSRISGISSEQMSELNNRIIALGVNFGKSGKEAVKFSEDALIVGGRLAQMGFDVADIMTKMTQQATGTEYGVIQSLIFGGPAGNISKRWGAVRGAAKNLSEIASGLPEEFREYFIKQAAPVFGLGGMAVGDIQRLSAFTGTEKAFSEEGRKERLDKGMGTEQDYLYQIAETSKKDGDFYKSAKDYFDSVGNILKNILTKEGLKIVDPAAEFVAKNRSEIANLAQNAVNWLEKGFQALLKGLEMIWGVLKQIHTFIEGIWGVVSRPKESVKNFVESFQQRISDAGKLTGANAGLLALLGPVKAATEIPSAAMGALGDTLTPLDKGAPLQRGIRGKGFPTLDREESDADLMLKIAEAQGLTAHKFEQGLHKPGSKHPLGKAIDISTTGMSQDKISSVVKNFQQMGLFANYEATGKKEEGFTGPHIHVGEDKGHTVNQSILRNKLSELISKREKSAEILSSTGEQLVHDRALNESVNTLTITINHLLAAMQAMGGMGVPLPATESYSNVTDYFNTPVKPAQG